MRFFGVFVVVVVVFSGIVIVWFVVVGFVFMWSEFIWSMVMRFVIRMSRGFVVSILRMFVIGWIVHCFDRIKSFKNILVVFCYWLVYKELKIVESIYF